MLLWRKNVQFVIDEELLENIPHLKCTAAEILSYVELGKCDMGGRCDASAPLRL